MNRKRTPHERTLRKIAMRIARAVADYQHRDVADIIEPILRAEFPLSTTQKGD